MFDLRGANAEAEGAQGTVGGGVTVACRDHHAGQDEALLWRNHVLDALTSV